VRSLQSLVNSLIVILTYIPCWGPVALALWLLSRKLRGSAAERKKWRDVEEEKRQRAWEDYQQARDTSGETAPPPDDEVDTE
jgi:purine-cytosine permease-like protein